MTSCAPGPRRALDSLQVVDGRLQCPGGARRRARSISRSGSSPVGTRSRHPRPVVRNSTLPPGASPCGPARRLDAGHSTRLLSLAGTRRRQAPRHRRIRCFAGRLSALGAAGAGRLGGDGPRGPRRPSRSPAAGSCRPALRPVDRMSAEAATWSERDLDRRFRLGPPQGRVHAARLDPRRVARPALGWAEARTALLGRALPRVANPACEDARPRPSSPSPRAPPRKRPGRRCLRRSPRPTS